MLKDKYVQYGCGLCAPDSWMNFDSSLNLRLERLPAIGKFYAGTKAQDNGNLIRARYPENILYGDIVRGLPVSDNSCMGVYASHILEHLSLDDFTVALENTFRILKPSGLFRLIVPDLEVAAQKYLRSESATASIEFLQSTYLGVQCRPKGLKGVAHTLLSNSSHFWMWDYKSLEQQLKQAGFVEIRKAAFNDSSDPMFKYVEEHSRFIDAVAVECMKSVTMQH